MKWSILKARLAKRLQPVSGDRSLEEMKAMEGAFAAIRLLAAPITLLMVWLHNPSSPTAMVVLAGLLLLASVVALYLNRRIRRKGAQLKLGVAMLTADALITWGILFLFAYDFYTSAYAYFALIVIGGAMRFGLAGSLAMAGTFAVGLIAAFAFRLLLYDVRFSMSGYAFWCSLMVLIALAAGLIVQEGQRERRRTALLAREGAALAERQRIARDLHDTVLKMVRGVALEVHALKDHTDSERVRQKVEYIEEVCHSSAEQMRDVIHQLRSESDEEFIGADLEESVRAWSERTGIPADFVISGKDRVLPFMATHNLRYVVSEALTNVEKHAGASHARVCLNIMPDRLQMEIADNGRGIGPVVDLYGFAATGKFGLIVMKERVEQLGGQFELEASGGIRIGISIPIDADG